MNTKSAYPARLYFTKFFTDGLLKGMRVEDDMGFVTAGDAMQWVRAVNAKNADGRLEYRVSAYSVNW